MNLSILKNGVVRQKGKYVQTFIVLGICLVVVSVAAIAIHKIADTYIFKGDSITHIKREWKAYNYGNVYDISANLLKKKPFNNTALIYHGYASFFLALAENDTLLSQTYFDEAIFNMRLALQEAKSRTVPQLEYMLGKAYFYKNTVSSYYYYSDLAVLYLTRAEKHGYKADDIPEYLGLSYAALDMTMESISAFTRALLTRETDLLLLSIAEQYYKAGQSTASEQYLYRISQDCKDERITDKSHVLLGKIYTEQKKYADAEKEFSTILEKNENSGDAYYGLGVLYESQGDLVKARSYWRKALKVQANHPDALKKMADLK